MLFHVLAILDIISVIIMLFGHYGAFKIPLLYVTIYFLAKLFFFRDVLSFIDVCAGIYCIFLFFGLSGILTWIFVAYFAYKTVVWLFFTMAN